MPRSLPVALVLAALLLLPLGACGDTDKGTGSGSGAGTDTAGAPPADGSPNGTELAGGAVTGGFSSTESAESFSAVRPWARPASTSSRTAGATSSAKVRRTSSLLTERM